MVVDTAISIAADHGSRSVQLSARSVQYHEPRPSSDDPATVVQQIKALTAVAAAKKAAEAAEAENLAADKTVVSKTARKIRGKGHYKIHNRRGGVAPGYDAEGNAVPPDDVTSAEPGLALPDPLQQIPVRLVTQSSGNYPAPPSMSKEDPDGSYAVWFSCGVSERDVSGV